MATQAIPAAGAPPPPPQGEQGGIQSILSNPLFRQIAQGLVIYQVVSLVFKGKNALSPTPPASPTGLAVENASPGTAVPVQPAGQVAPKGQHPPLIPVWQPKTRLDVSLRLSAEEDPLAVDLGDETYPGVTWEGIEWSNSGWEKVWETEWDVPESVQHNATFYLDTYITRTGLSPNPADPTYPSSGEVLHVRKPLVRYAQQKRVRATKNLLSGSKNDHKEEEVEETAEEKDARPIISYYYPNITLELVCDSGSVPLENLPEPLKQHVHVALDGARTFDGKQAYFPITFANEFWQLSTGLQAVNTTTTRLPLRVEFHPTSHFKFQLIQTMNDAFTKQSATSGMGGGGELDEVKRMLTETNPILLITTAVVSALHMLFEFLAFTADVKHLRNRKDTVGVSLRTIIYNLVTQLIILLYLVDQSEQTSWAIMASSGMGLASEAYKITKAVDIAVVPHPSRPLFPYQLSIKDKHVPTEEELTTREADKLAFKYVGWAAGPLLVGWTVWSLYAGEHRSWYSFSIQTLTSFVQAFGFVSLVPQLVINYKLKSVAHIPMKAMGYKVLSTVIDDFFSFIIKMPMLHRLACFRDDVVFLILLYQMWIYRVDYSRQNEYGQVLSEDEAKKLLEKKQGEEREKLQHKGKEAMEEDKKTK